MNVGRQVKVPVPEFHREFRVIRTHGRVFAIPPTLNFEGMLRSGSLFTHPAVLSAATVDEIRERIDSFDAIALRPVNVGQYENYNLIRLRDSFYAVPDSAEPVDLELQEERRRASVLSGNSVVELEKAIRKNRSAITVEFAGWLPIFEFSGNCGRHPQFAHTGNPPAGYRFSMSSPPEAKLRKLLLSRLGGRVFERVGKILRGVNAVARVPIAFFRPCRGVSVRARLRVFFAAARLFVSLMRRGCKLTPTLKFMQSRHLQSQLLLGDQRGLVFLTSMPYTYGQNPWVIEIEDPTTLFYPLIQNGHTCDMPIADSPYIPIVKALLEADHCKAIVTHMKSTAEMVPTLFQSDAIREKVIYAPLGVKLPARWQRHDPQPADEPIHLLFINSWCQVPENFYVRGGLDVLEAFATLRIRYPQLRLTMRTSLPALSSHYHRIMEEGWVRLFNRFVTAEEMAALHAESHIYLLPAARVHIVSLLQAMSYGLAVVASDGWGMEEYVDHERNGLVVKGRYGKTSWADREAGVLRENYEPMYTSDPDVVQGIVDAVSRLVEDRQLRARLGRAARSDVETKFNLEQWNRGLQTAFDRARGATGISEPRPLGSGQREVSSLAS